jgi:hypothetical protein
MKYISILIGFPFSGGPEKRRLLCIQSKIFHPFPAPAQTLPPLLSSDLQIHSNTEEHIVHPADDMSMDSHGGTIVAGETENLGENLSHCHFVKHNHFTVINLIC